MITDEKLDIFLEEDTKKSPKKKTVKLSKDKSIIENVIEKKFLTEDGRQLIVG